MNHLAAFMLRLAAASVWQSPGEHHRPGHRYATRCAKLALLDGADAYDTSEL